MKPVFQTRFGDPEGNCFAACVASILECELSDLRDFNDLPEGRNWLEWFNEGLTEYSIFQGEATAKNPFMGYVPTGTHFIVAGLGKRGLSHCVVMRSCGVKAEEHQDELAHDPFPGGSGLDTITHLCLVVKR